MPTPHHPSPALAMSSPSSPLPCDESLTLRKLPTELQVNLLTYLRAYDLSAVQLTCRHFGNPLLVDAIVRHTAEHVYPPSLTAGFDEQPLSTSSAASNMSKSATNKTSNKKGANRADLTASSTQPSEPSRVLYTFEHLRNMELLVIARVLSRPEPQTGFFVSKSWCKTALRWLEEKQQQAAEKHNNHNNKKLSKKKQRIRNRRLSDVSPPWPNVNSDLLCEHAGLQRCTNNKSARARRRLLDKQAWKILKKLYPDSEELDSTTGECLQCILEAETEKRTLENRAEQMKLERKRPLANPHVRQFYTRTRGVPTHALKQVNQNSSSSSNNDIAIGGNSKFVLAQCVEGDDDDIGISMSTLNVAANASTMWSIQDQDQLMEDVEEKKPTAIPASSHVDVASCPLQDGLYFVLPRSWCHGWRRFIKTGDVGDACYNGSSTNCQVSQAMTYCPPDAAGLLCDAHRLPLIPPHLQAFLTGQASQLLGSSGNLTTSTSSSLSNMESSESNIIVPPPVAAVNNRAGLIPGQAPDAASIEALRAAGLSPTQVGAQIAAMQSLERQRLLALQQQQQQQRSFHLWNDESSSSLNAAAPGEHHNHPSTSQSYKNEALDRENHSVVEILTQTEFQALKACWSPATAACLFCLSFRVATSDVSGLTTVSFCTEPCRECDATGRSCAVSIKTRSRNWVRKSSEKARAPASLEY